MIRRAGILALLLLSLLGAVPAALACAVAAGSMDCCAPDGSCPTDTPQPAISASVSAACCFVGSEAQQVVVAVGTRAESPKIHPGSLDTSGACPTKALHIPADKSGSPHVPIDASVSYTDQQQTYLLTGRLRL